MLGNPYQALYGLGAYQVMYGAAENKPYKKMLQLMAKRIRLKKKLTHTRNDKKRTQIKKELAMLNKHIAHLKAQLQNQGADTSEAESAAATIEATTPDTGSDSGTGTSAAAKMLRRKKMLRKHHVRRMGSARRSRMMKPKRRSRTLKPKGYAHKRVKGRQGIRTSAVRHHKYALRKQHAQQIRRYGQQHRARLPGQRQFDGRRRQGPISASEIQQAPVAADADMNDDGMLDAGVMPEMSMSDELSMDPNMTSEMYATDTPDIDFETDGMTADEALSGVMDFAGDLWSNKFFRYGAIGLGLWAVFGKKLR